MIILLLVLQQKWEATEAGKEVPRPVPPPPLGMPATSTELPKGLEAVTMFNNMMAAYWSQARPISLAKDVWQLCTAARYCCPLGLVHLHILWSPTQGHAT